MSKKRCWGFFLFCLDLELLKKNAKNESVEARSFLIFGKKHPVDPSVDIGN